MKDSLLYTDLLSSVDQLLGDAEQTAQTVDAAAEFESACGSPEQPVDLTALDGISLDFPLNSYGDISYPGETVIILITFSHNISILQSW